jgi:hypothetical protein
VLSGVLLGLIVLMRLWPSAPIVRTLHTLIVEIPAMWLARTERRHVIAALVFAAMLIGGWEIIATFGSFDALLAFSFDLSIYLDAVGAVIAVAAASRVKTTYQLMKAQFVSKRVQPVRDSRRRAAREVRSRRVRRIANDDDKRGRTIRRAA